MCKRSVLAALLATPLVTTATNSNKCWSVQKDCWSVRKELAASYLSDISYPADIPNSERRAIARSFSQAWKKLAKERNGKEAICEEAISPKAVRDLVKVCNTAGLDLDGCTEIVDTMVWLTSQNEGGGGTQGGRDGNGIVCPQDANQCPDGSYVGRNPNDNCSFHPCPGEFIASNGWKCPCAGSINMVTANDRLSDNSCENINNCNYLLIQQWMDPEIPGYPTGSWARFDDDEGECADGDAIRIITREEGIACVEQIAHACRRLVHPIFKRNEFQP